jgi:hypothetical protein
MRYPGQTEPRPSIGVSKHAISERPLCEASENVARVGIGLSQGDPRAIEGSIQVHRMIIRALRVYPRKREKRNRLIARERYLRDILDIKDAEG